MRKMVIIVILLGLISLCFSITLSDLDYEEQLIVKDFVISLDEDITEMNVEQLEGIEYNVIFENDDYIIIEINGEYFLIPRS